MLAVRRHEASEAFGANFPNGTRLTEVHARTVLDAFGGATALRTRGRKPPLQSRAPRGRPVRRGALSDQEVTNFLSQQYRVPTIDLEAYEVRGEILLLLSRELCERHVVLPVSRAGTSLVVAMLDPHDDAALAALKLASACAIEPVLATEGAIRAAIARYYAHPAASA